MTKKPKRYTRNMLLRRMKRRYEYFLHLEHIPEKDRDEYECLCEFFDEPVDEDNDEAVITYTESPPDENGDRDFVSTVNYERKSQ